MKTLTLLTINLLLSITLFSQDSHDKIKDAIDQIQTDPFLLDENISSATLTFGQRFPKVAFDGSIYLVAWRDFRTQSTQNADVYACRVDEDGNPLDLGGIPICTVQRNQVVTDVMYDGTNFIVVWFDDREQGQTEVYFARVTSSGMVLDPDGIQATNGINMVSSNNPCAGTGNGITLIAWCEDQISGTHAAKCIRIDNLGNILDPEGFTVSDTLNDDVGEMAIGFDGTNFLIVWESGMYSLNDDIRGARISPSGDVLDPGGFTIAYNPDEQTEPALCFGADNYLVTWSDEQGGDEDIYGTFVSPDGIVTDSSGFAISTATDQQENPRLTFDGTNFIVAWTDRRAGWDVYATAVAQDGSVLEPEGWGVGAWPDTDTRDCDIASGSEHIFVVWEIDRFPMEEDIQGGRITIENYSMIDWDGFDISLGVYAHANPDVAFDGINYLSVWEDYRNGIAQVYGTRVTVGGEILDPDGIYIGSNDTMRVRFPRVTFNGTNYVVVWNFQRASGYSGGAVMARVSTEGELIDDPPIAIVNDNNSSRNFRACSDGNNTLVAWNAWNVNSLDIYGALAYQDGTVGVPFIICDAEEYQEFPNLAFNGTNYLAVWEDSRQTSKDIFGTLISPDGVVMNPDGIEICTNPSWDNRPSAASNGNNFMISWHSGNSAGESIYGLLLNPDGAVSGSPSYIYEASQFEYAQHADVAYNGSNYYLSWQVFTSTEPDYNIMGASVDTDCSVNQLFIIDESVHNQFAPHVVAGNTGQIIAVYSGFTEEINNQEVLTSRSYGIFMDQLIGEDEKHISYFDFEVYPNPAGNWFKVQDLRFKVGVTKIELFDIFGRQVEVLFEGNLYRDQLVFDVSHFPSGIYLCRLTVDNKHATKKLIIQK